MSQQAPGGQAEDEGETEPQPAITWEGQQWQMEGYCGRAKPQAAPPPASAVEVRPVAVVRTRRSRGKVVRIGPPKELPAA